MGRAENLGGWIVSHPLHARIYVSLRALHGGLSDFLCTDGNQVLVMSKYCPLYLHVHACVHARTHTHKHTHTHAHTHTHTHTHTQLAGVSTLYAAKW